MASAAAVRNRGGLGRRVAVVVVVGIGWAPETLRRNIRAVRTALLADMRLPTSFSRDQLEASLRLCTESHTRNSGDIVM